MDDLPVIHLCLFGCGLVVSSAPTRQSDLGPHKVNVIAGAMGEIMIIKRDVKQGKVLILYNTIKKS